MSKFVFKRKTDGFYTDSKTSVSFTAKGLEEVLEEFTYFLKGCGFELDGRVGIVTDQIEVNTDWDDMFSDKIEIKPGDLSSGDLSSWPYPMDPPPMEDWPTGYENYGKDDIITLVNSSPTISMINLDNIHITSMGHMASHGHGNIGSSVTDDIIITTNAYPSER